MQSLNLEHFQPYLIIIIGIVSIIISLLRKTKPDNLEKIGARCEGIIFKLGYKNTAGSSLNDSMVKDKITVRFVTEKKQWITEDLNTDYMIAYTGQYKEGDKVVVIYNPDKPSEFTIETKQSKTAGRLIIFFVGLVFTGAGMYQLFKPS